MAKFNTKGTVFHVPSTSRDVKTENKAGGPAFQPSSRELELALRVISSFVSEDAFYASGKQLDTEMKAILADVLKTNPTFVAALAKKARKDWYLRSASANLLAEIALSPYKTNIYKSRKYVEDSILRVDDMMELVAACQNKMRASNSAIKGKVPMMVKFGLAEAFTKFDEYQYSKYDRPGGVTLRDVMRICRPKPKDAVQAEVFQKIRSGTLSPAYTWEVQLSTKGNTKEVWEDMIDSGRLPYFAMIRNLRNMLKAGISEKSAEKVVNTITTLSMIEKSKMFPFRFFSAERELTKGPIYGRDPYDDVWDRKNVKNEVSEINRGSFINALNEALELSICNIPDLPGTTFITCDNSGSMSSTNLSKNSSVNCQEVASLFGAMVHGKCEKSIVSAFGNSFKVIPLVRKDSILSKAKTIVNTNVGGATYGHLAFEYLVDNKIKVDRIMFFSDMQCYNSHSGYGTDIASAFINYKRMVNPNVRLYSVDLASYGTVQIPSSDRNTCCIGGYSDKVLSFIPMFEKDHKSLVAEIEKEIIR